MTSHHHHGDKGKKGDEEAHAMIAYIVPPDAGDEFVSAWHEAAEDTIQEEGNKLYRWVG